MVDKPDLQKPTTNYILAHKIYYQLQVCQPNLNYMGIV